MIEALALVPFFLCWGSFLNVAAYRLVRDQSIVWPRSCCPACGHQIFWYDLIPVISWLALSGRCRTCKHPISALYPFIELLTAVLLTTLYVAMPLCYFIGYALFFSALIVTIRSDLETMLISRFVTLFMVPVGIICSLYGLIPLTPIESVAGTCAGYFFLYAIAALFKLITKKDGMGQGDVELLAFIGSFTGILGCWTSLMIGSVLGSLVGIVYLLIAHGNRNTKIPFGPFLALGAIVYVFAQDCLMSTLA